MTTIIERTTDENKPKNQPKYSLFEMREKSGISGAEVAKVCNITYKSLRNWELGKTVPNLVNVRELLLVYGFEYDQLDLSLYYGYDKHHEPTELPRKLKLPQASQDRLEAFRVQYRNVDGE